jgi:hypothetical protein
VTPDEVRASAERVKQLGILVYTIGLGQDVDHALLRDIAGKPAWYFRRHTHFFATALGTPTIAA